jgi:hypothetical protein
MSEPTPRRWQEIAPADAERLTAGQDGITAPQAQNGKPCPWPWWPQQFLRERERVCPHCGSPVLTGQQHPDYGAVFQPIPTDKQEQVTTRDDIPKACCCLWFQSKTWPTVARTMHSNLCTVHGPRAWTDYVAQEHMAED